MKDLDYSVLANWCSYLAHSFIFRAVLSETYDGENFSNSLWLHWVPVVSPRALTNSASGLLVFFHSCSQNSLSNEKQSHAPVPPYTNQELCYFTWPYAAQAKWLSPHGGDFYDVQWKGSALHITLRLVRSFLETGGVANYPISGKL